MTPYRTKLKTNDKMLPQSCPLELPLIFPTGNKEGDIAGSMHCQGERVENPSHNHIAICETNRVTDSNTRKVGQNRVFVLNKSPLMPCHPARARMLLKKGKAKAIRRAPFALRLNHNKCKEVQPITIKLDPGAKFTGIALVSNNRVLWLGELAHRKNQIRLNLLRRRGYRRRRRRANLRSRKSKFKNRRGIPILPPSTKSIAESILSWVKKLERWAPLNSVVIEYISFSNPSPKSCSKSNKKESLLRSANYSCSYCGKTNIPLEKDHIIARGNLGSDKLSNLTLTCRKCNEAKSKETLPEFLGENPTELKKLENKLQKPLDSRSAVNTYKTYLVDKLNALGLDIKLSTGEKTESNRRKFNIPKSHALDAAFAGQMETSLKSWNKKPLIIKSQGRGSYARTRADKYGFPRLYMPRTKIVLGFKTGDIVKSPKGTGRISVRSNGYFHLKTNKGKTTTIKHNLCKLLQRCDGYSYQIS